ncbi:MAG: PDZ domain-containing protein [Candidatus Acidiferrales bacterium]
MNLARIKFLFSLGVTVFILFCAFGTMPRTPALAADGLEQQTPSPGPPARFAFGGNAAQIPAAFVGNLIFMPVRVSASKTLLFELDSAAVTSSIDPERASELGLKLESDGAGAGSAGQTVKNVDLSLPGLDIPMASLPAISRQNFAAETGQSCQGVLGKDFFDRVVMEVDYIRETVQLHDPAVFTYEGTGKSFPLAFPAGIPLLRAKSEISGRKTIEADFGVDTALDASILFFRSFSDAEKISAARFKTVSASYPQIDDGAKILLGRLRNFQIGPFLAETPVAIFSQSNSGGTPGNKLAGSIGGDFLHRFTVIFDFPHQRIILNPNLQFNHSIDEDMSGLSLIAKGANLKTFEVVQVQPGTPAADAGIQKGDIIVAVDDEAAADLALAAIRGLFRQVGHEYKLLIDRKGQSITVSIKMRRLL